MLSASEIHAQRREFGHAIAGPILADMLRRLYCQLHGSSKTEAPLVFFCARGGLVLRRALQLFAERAGLELQIECKDFMISRLAAFRVALQANPTAVAPLVDMEFSGRTCAEATRALTGVEVDRDACWDAPFSLERWIELARSTEAGRVLLAINDEQAYFLQRHIDLLRGDRRRVVLCDTGVFGSILRYLQVGMPAVDWSLTLLFRANYKRISAPHFGAAVGVVSESNTYLPWHPTTVALLYWQLFEAMLEPAVPSVRFYREETGRVVSNLEITGWQSRLTPSSDSMLAGAYCYLDELTPASLSSISSRAKFAWRRLRRKIVLPTTEDVALLAVGRRAFDFGMDGSAEFSHRPQTGGRSLREKVSLAKASMWPEGEIRKQLPQTASLLLLGWEFGRLMKALNRSYFLGSERRPEQGSASL